MTSRLFKWIGITACLWPALVSVPAMRITLDRGPAGEFRVRVRDGEETGGYAVLTRAGLGDGSWSFAGGADRWPDGGTEWTFEPAERSGFFRVRRSPRGEDIDPRRDSSYSRFAISLSLGPNGIDFIDPDYGVTVYTLSYDTFDHRGLASRASGRLCIPQGSGSFPLLSYQHGTMYKRSEAVACVDMLRAVRTYVEQTSSLSLNGDLYIFGYSQGGHATLALQRELETRHGDEFSLTASAPMAGPHDLSGVMADLMLGPQPSPDPGYSAYLLLGYNGVYRWFDDLSDVLVPPYDVTLPAVLDGEHTAAQVNAEMPDIPREIFRPEFIAEFDADPDHVFREALRANDTYREWVPAVTTRFYHCSGDTTVPKENSWTAYSNFFARGCRCISIEDPGPVTDHEAGALPCIEAALQWFETLRAR
ncbi:hypothetical protein [Kiritimatiella glycovorans]|nr:hypothetical protein [Kiritimatiella glycovorans]